MHAYIMVMEGVAATLSFVLAAGLARCAVRAPRAFRVASLAGVGVCVLLGITATENLAHTAALNGVVPEWWRAALSGPLAAVRATVAVVIAAWALLQGLRYWSAIGQGQTIVDALTDRVPADAHARQVGLSAREVEVLDLIRAGILSDEAIARALHISRATAATHVQNILRKTSLHNRRDLMLLRRPSDQLRKASG